MNKREVIEYLKTHELDVQSAVASYIALSVAFESYVDAYEVLGFDYNPCFSHFEKSYREKAYFHQIVSKRQIEDNSDKIFLNYLKDPKSFDKFVENHRRAGEKACIIWREYKNNPRKNRKLLEQKFSQFLKAESFFWYYTLAGEDKGEVIERKIIPRFSKLRNISKEEAREAIQVLSHPKEPAIFNVERRDFLKLCLLFLDDEKETEDKIKKYLKKYFWFKTDFYGNKKFDENVVASEIKKEISEKSRKKIEEEINEIEESFLKIVKKKESLLKKLSLNEEERQLVDFAEKLSFRIDERKCWMMEQFFYLFDFVEEVARVLRVSYEEISLCGREEIIDCLKEEKGLEKSILKARQGEFFVAFERIEREKFFFGKDARDILETALKKGEGETKGMVASKGKRNIVSGKAKVVIHIEKDNFEKNEILITSMTRVEFVPFMKKAKAVITDEGGMACHAAIVSRELGLPAIIGTKNATKKIKNGDLIEMNMRTGEVKVIKK